MGASRTTENLVQIITNTLTSRVAQRNVETPQYRPDRRHSLCQEFEIPLCMHPAMYHDHNYTVFPVHFMYTL